MNNDKSLGAIQPRNHDKPLAAAPLKSFRYRGRYGYVMIGATDVADALREAGRSLENDTPTMDRLELWDARARSYVPALPEAATRHALTTGHAVHITPDKTSCTKCGDITNR